MFDTGSVSQPTATIARDALVGDVEHDLALGGLAAGALRRLRDALLAQQLLRRLEVAAGLLERALAVHHPRAGLLAELLDEAGGDRRRSSTPPPPPASRLGLGVASGFSASASARPALLGLRGSASAAGCGRRLRHLLGADLLPPGLDPVRDHRASRASTSGSRRRFRG